MAFKTNFIHQITLYAQSISLAAPSFLIQKAMIMMTRYGFSTHKNIINLHHTYRPYYTIACSHTPKCTYQERKRNEERIGEKESWSS